MVIGQKDKVLGAEIVMPAPNPLITVTSENPKWLVRGYEIGLIMG